MVAERDRLPPVRGVDENPQTGRAANLVARINYCDALALPGSYKDSVVAIIRLEQTLKGNGVEISRREVGRDAEGGSRPCQNGPPPLVRMRVG